MSEARKNYNVIPYRLMSFADVWIFLNLGLAIFISVPAFNFYTHGTHITVAHAMGATIGINTMLLFACILYVLKDKKPMAFSRSKKMLASAAYITNIALAVFWLALIASGVVKILGNINHEPFAVTMEKSKPLFKLFALSGAAVLAGLLLMIIAAFRIIGRKENAIELSKNSQASIEMETVT
jgi:nitric oxide reductase subunit B